MDRNNKSISTQGRRREELLVLLEEAQRKFSYIPREFVVEMSKYLNVSVSEVYGVATFYSFLSTNPQGRHVIRICRSVPCLLKNCQTLIRSIEAEIGIKPGETTADDKFSFQLTNCIGVCDRAPAMMIDSNVYVDLTSKEISRILKQYK